MKLQHMFLYALSSSPPKKTHVSSTAAESQGEATSEVRTRGERDQGEERPEGYTWESGKT